MEFPLLQSKAWEKLQSDLGETCFFEQTKDYTFLAILKKTKLGNYFYLPYGPYIAKKSAGKAAYQALERLARSKNITFIRIEPQNAENASYLLNLPNCKKSHDLSPKDTWVLDLTPNTEAIFANMKQNTRNLSKNFHKKGLFVTASKNPDDITHLVRLQHKLAAEKKIGTFSEKYLKTELMQDFATLYLVHFTDPKDSSDKIIAASLFFDFENSELGTSTRFYMQSAADMDYKKLPGTVAILATALFDAKEKGLKNFDFWGIAPDGAPSSHPWAGFTQFKKSFGGHEVHYAGTYDIILNSKKYRTYSMFRKLNRIFRKITHKTD